MEFSERILKGRVAETIVSEMLQDAGYFVYRFGYEGILQSLTQRGLPKMNDDDLVAAKIRTMPDFVAMKDGDVSFIEVKFRSGNGPDGSLHDWAEKARKYWPESKLIIVRPEAPYFSISTVKHFARTGRLYQLAEDRYIKVESEIIERYEELVSRYCRK